MTKKALVLFSGGRDSSVVAGLLAQKNFDLDLLIFDNGASSKIDLIEYRINELKENFPLSKIKVTFENCSSLLKDIALIHIEDDIKKYGYNLICMGCKLAMLSQAVCYCIDNKINLIATGFVAYENEWPEQMPDVLPLLETMLKKYSIKFINPIYFVESKVEIKKILSKMGLSTNSLEPTCLFGDTAALPDPNTVVNYVNDKLILCYNYIENYLFSKYNLADSDPILLRNNTRNGHKVIVLSHCFFNLFARAKGVSKANKNWATVDHILSFLREKNVGIIQLPCPEILYQGLNRDACGIENYDNEKYKKICQKIVDDYTYLIEEYLKSNLEVQAIVGINGSPSCGIDYTYSSKRKKLNRKGVFLDKFNEHLKRKNIVIPFIGVNISSQADIYEAIRKLHCELEA
ncbi:DUF523 domain-containing protein [candidate division KSB1 bacterium]|nr:DUF523 domain-containing protein [candidate division KSB1 bacterium]